MTTYLTRTPPDIKWLLNERAALVGVVVSATAKQEQLKQKRNKLEKQMESIERALARAAVARMRAQASIDALDATMALVNAQLNPCAAGTVQAWAGKYGARGGLHRQT